MFPQDLGKRKLGGRELLTAASAAAQLPGQGSGFTEQCRILPPLLFVHGNLEIPNLVLAKKT